MGNHKKAGLINPVIDAIDEFRDSDEKNHASPYCMATVLNTSGMELMVLLVNALLCICSENALMHTRRIVELTDTYIIEDPAEIISLLVRHHRYDGGRYCKNLSLRSLRSDAMALPARIADATPDRIRLWYAARKRLRIKLLSERKCCANKRYGIDTVKVQRANSLLDSLKSFQIRVRMLMGVVGMNLSGNP
jgi:hypothetical protein